MQHDTDHETNAMWKDLSHRAVSERPSTEDMVFTHGDFCLPNIFIDPHSMSISGFIDLGYAGIADRYQDLALACWSLGYNFDKKWIPLLLQEYGIVEPDYQKLDYYQSLEQFF